jgi:hypothetical protein
MKVRQGRKAATLISGFEPFLVVDAEEMAEDLRKACAGATSGVFFPPLMVVWSVTVVFLRSISDTRETCGIGQ